MPFHKNKERWLCLDLGTFNIIFTKGYNVYPTKTRVIILVYLLLLRTATKLKI